jgi:hypothetical protein
MTLPVRVIDRLFERLLATYGQQWQGLWSGVPIVDVKSLWAAELALFADRLDAIGWALENLPERPPNLVQFKALCRQAPRPEVPALPLPERNPERMREALQGLRALTVGDREASAQLARVGGRLSDGRTPAQAVVDGLIKRGEVDRLNPAQVSVLRAAVSVLRDDDERRANHVVARHVPVRVSEVEQENRS